MPSLLPPNASRLEQAVDTGIGHRVEGIALGQVSRLWDAAACPVHLLPWLAWAESVDEWSNAWSTPVKRAVIAAQREIRRRRGTRRSVSDAIQAFGGNTVLREWWEHTPKRTPHTFDIVITGGAEYVNAGFQQSMMRAIERNKPARSHYTLTIGLTAAAQLGIVGVARVATFKRMRFQA